MFRFSDTSVDILYSMSIKVINGTKIFVVGVRRDVPGISGTPNLLFAHTNWLDTGYWYGTSAVPSAAPKKRALA